MRRFMFQVLDFAIRILVRARNCFATPVPEARLYRALAGNRRTLLCDGRQQQWTVEEILAREG